jgi:predicted Ser/Thr protein kinase
MELWNETLTQLGILDGVLLRGGEEDRPQRRVYKGKGRIYKIHMVSAMSAEQGTPGALRQEYEILQSCQGAVSVPRPLEYIETGDAEVAVYEELSGAGWRGSGLDVGSALGGLWDVAKVLWQLSWRGIAHRDLRVHNVWVDGNGRIVLLDFDKARRCSPGRAFFENFVKKRRSRERFCGSFAGLVARVLGPKVPEWAKAPALMLSSMVGASGRFVKRIAHWVWRRNGKSAS